jgi:DNA-directed RNA polymerase specialized sigma24 family protein
MYGGEIGGAHAWDDAVKPHTRDERPYGTGRRRQVDEATEQRRADAELVRRLAGEGFSGPAYEQLERRLVGYSYQVLHKWLRSGYIYAVCAERRVRGLPPEGAAESWTLEDREDIVQDTVAEALVTFQRDALRGGGWRADGGASLTTYFMNTCLFAFAHVSRRFQRAERCRRQVEDRLGSQRHADEVPDPAAGVIDGLAITRLLASIDDPRLRLAVSLTCEGYTQAEIAAALGNGTTARAVEGMLHRYRQRMVAAREEVAGDD